MRGFARAALAVIGIGAFAAGDVHADTGTLPMMDHERPVLCMRDKHGELWRIQCTPATKVCLYAADSELALDGSRTKALERARQCAFDETLDRTRLEAAGYQFIAGRADAPYGWTRDERGRVFQVNFDLRKRLYFGAAYTPQKVLENPLETKRSSIDFGLFSVEFLVDGDTPTRHRLRFVQGEVHMEPFSAEVTMAHYDVSRRFLDPLLRFTTFVGTPRRYDLHLDLGMWSEAGGLEIRRTPTDYSTLWRHATAQVTLDLWQSPSLDSFARVRTGFGLEGQHTDLTGYRSAITESSAFELDWVLDPSGLHNLRLELVHELPRYFEPAAEVGKLRQRMRARLQYEAVVIAINDQPLTLKLAAGGEKRNDLLGVADQWAFVMDAGLRFSLWAPPRAHF
jgi:hypothetical protein